MHAYRSADTSLIYVTVLCVGDIGVSVSIAMIVGLCITYPITLYPADEIVQHALYTHVYHHHDVPVRVARCVRAVLVLCTCIIAYVFPNFSTFADLIGSCMLMTNGFITPAACYLALHWPHTKHAKHVASFISTQQQNDDAEQQVLQDAVHEQPTANAGDSGSLLTHSDDAFASSWSWQLRVFGLGAMIVAGVLFAIIGTYCAIVAML